MPSQPDFAWFEDQFGWSLLSLRILFAGGRSWQQMLEAFGSDPAATQEETLQEQAYPKDHPTVRAGEHEGWGYTIETDFDPSDQQLERVSIDGKAFGLVYTATISMFRHAVAGDYVFGFDVTVPHIRWRDERRFETEIAEAFSGSGGAAESLRFVRLAFGVTMTPEMIGGPLPSIARPRPPERPSGPVPPPPPINWPRP